MRTIATLAIALAVLAPVSVGQIMSSQNFELQGLSYDSVAGGASSELITSYVQVGPLEAEKVTSTHFQSEIGFLVSFDPDPGTLPVVYTVLPHHADKAGGVPLEIYGRNLDISVFPQVQIGGGQVIPTVVSGTKLTGNSPVGAAGLADVQITHAGGTTLSKEAFIFSPAIIMPVLAYQDSLYPVRAYGDTSHFFQTWASTTLLPSPVNTNFGQLIIGPAIFQVLPTLPYFQPSGLTEFSTRIPISAQLIGFTIYFQNVDLGPIPPGALTNLAESTFQ